MFITQRNVIKYELLTGNNDCVEMTITVIALEIHRTKRTYLEKFRRF